MVVVSYSGKEINAKLVYYGPGLSGKTTNLEYIYQSVPSTNRGKMVSMKTRTERTLFFDFLPIDLGDIGGFKTRFLLYTVPGQVYYNATRKLVLRGVDAVIFVADSGRGKMEENIESLQNLRENLREYGLSIEEIPWVLQYNKRDLPDAYTIEELEEALNPGGIPYYEAVATTGQGVFECFRGIARLLLQKLSTEIKLGGGAATRASAQPPLPVRPAPLAAPEAPKAAAAQTLPPPMGTPAAPPRPQAPPPPRPYRPAAPAGGDRAKPAGRPTFNFPAAGASGAPSAAPRPLSRPPVPDAFPGNDGGEETGIDKDPFAIDGLPTPAAPPRGRPGAPATPTRVPVPPPAAEEEPALAFGDSDADSTDSLSLDLEAPLPAFEEEEESAPPPFQSQATAEISLQRGTIQPPRHPDHSDEERMRRAADLAGRLREAETREAEREARKEGGLLGRLFKRRSRDRIEPEDETLSAPFEEEIDQPLPTRAVTNFPSPFEERGDGAAGIARYETPEIAETEDEEETGLAAVPQEEATLPSGPVTIERRIHVPITLGPEEMRRGTKLRLVLEINVESAGSRTGAHDPRDGRESKVA